MVSIKYQDVSCKQHSNIDSNQKKRDERDSYLKEVTNLNTKVENKHSSLQGRIRDLSVKLEDQTADNSKLRSEVSQLRQSTNTLAEDLKQYQSKEENLAKMLLAEEESSDKAKYEALAMKQEKVALDTLLASLNSQIQRLSDEKHKLSKENENTKQLNIDTNREVIELKKIGQQRHEEISKLINLSHSLNIQIQSLSDEKRNKIMECNDLSDENERLRGLNETFTKKFQDAEDSHVTLVKELQVCVQSLIEEKNKFSRELEITKAQLLSCEQTRGKIETAKFQIDSMVSVLEKDLAELHNIKDTNIQLTRINESLKTRVSQLNRRLFSMRPMNEPTTPCNSTTNLPTIQKFGHECLPL